MDWEEKFYHRLSDDNSKVREEEVIEYLNDFTRSSVAKFKDLEEGYNGASSV